MAAARAASPNAVPTAGLDAPWRAAPLDADGRAAYVRALAARQRVVGNMAPRDLLALLATNADAVRDACDAFDGAARASLALPPAGARLLDDYPLFDAQVRLARGQLLHDARRLPRLVQEGEPRIWRLMLDVVAHGDGHVDAASLERFLAAYGDSAPLTIAELDAVPALLRMALLDNLRRLAARAARICRGRDQAAQWAIRLSACADDKPGDLLLLVADMVRSMQALEAGFVAELARRLLGRGAQLQQVLEWIDARLLDDGASIAQLVQRDETEQADDAVSVGNTLASLRMTGGVDWSALAERLGAAEQVLRLDPDGSYQYMDSATRAGYRRAVERLACGCNRSEIDVAQEAIALAGVHRAPGEGGLDGRTRHVGYYLIGQGLTTLRTRLGGSVRKLPLPGHVGATLVLTLAILSALLVNTWQGGAGLALLALVGILALPGAGELAHALVRMMAAWLTPARAAARMRVDGGIARDAHTVVAVSALLSHAEDMDALCSELEVRYFGNRDPRLRFCLLLDLADAATEQLPNDAALCEGARLAIEALNRKHGHEATHGPFMLLLRARTWNAGEGAWIGRERRRGQLADLNAWLCGARERFLLAAGNTGAATEVRYVIALDADTALGPGAARSLVAAMTHPLNCPQQGDDGRVRQGHGLLRIEVRAALPLDAGARYQRLCSSGARSWAAIGAGCGAAPDAGHGWAAIYDVDAWRRALGEELRDEGRAEPGLVEEDRLRAGQVSDLQLETRHVGSYGEHVLRRHRALRGAWQEAHRLKPGASDSIHSSRQWWTLFDRLRSSLVAPTLVALLVLCWSTLAAPVFWAAAALAVFFVPALIGMLVALADRPHDAPWRQHLDAWARGARVPLVRAALSAAFLPHAAWYAGDALARSMWRRRVTRHKLLEMRPAALSRPSASMENNWRNMWFAPLLAVGVAVLLTFANPYALFACAPLLLVWFLSPVLAWWASQPARRALRLGARQTTFLRALARRTWAFFEEHGAAAHGLAPEAVLEHPAPLLDNRVSPGGMGLSLLAGLSARDFGFISIGELVQRSDKALSSMALLEHWNGHLFDGYDGATLGALEPARVDTAASGKLVLALRTFAAGLDEVPDQPIASAALLDGLRATLEVVRQHAPANPALDAVAQALGPERCRATNTLPGLIDCLSNGTQAAAQLMANLSPGDDPALRAWAGRLATQCRVQLDDLYTMAPWMRAAQEYVLGANLTSIPTLRQLAQIDVPDTEALAQLVDAGRRCARERLAQLAALAEHARELACADFSKLIDPATGLLAAGWQVRDKRFDLESCDLLASSARMASFAAVAQGQLAPQHWFALGRAQRMGDSGALLLSRHGALLDYLAPQLIMPSWRDTLLASAARAAVRMQAIHAKRHGVLWGYSTSLCNAVDADARYRSMNFGLPAAALQRRAVDDLAAAPYAAALGLLAAPALAATNLERMAAQGLLGEIGMHEAIDYAPGRLPQGERQAVVRAYTAPHQAMTLLALAGHLLDQPMQRRFCADPELRAALGLLQEAPPASGAAAALRHASDNAPAPAHPHARVIRGDTSLAQVQLLSNGRLHLVLNSDGSAITRWDGLPVTRPGRDQIGMVCRLRDMATGHSWSTTQLAGAGETIFAEGRASFHRVEGDIQMWTDVAVAPEDDVELRRIRIVNSGLDTRTLELTGSVALAGPPVTPGGRSGIQREFDAATGSLLCVTTPEAPVLVQRMALRGMGGEPDNAAADLEPEPDQASMLLRRTATLAPGQQLVVDLMLGAASSRAVARELALRYGAGHAVDHAIDAAWTHGQALLHRLGLRPADAQLYTRLAACLLQPTPALRTAPAVIARNVLGRAALLGYGIHGALPILVLEPGQEQGNLLSQQVLQAHVYWRSRGFAVDLLVLCESRAAREGLMHLAAALLDPDSFDAPGGVHLVQLNDVPQEERILLRASAHVLLTGERGDLADQLRRATRAGVALPPPFAPSAEAPSWSVVTAPQPRPSLISDNGIGGFIPDGREYVIHSGVDLDSPWGNPLANSDFGCVVSERGHTSNWNGERAAHITIDGGEAFYLRDEDSGAFWSPTPWPAPSGEPYLTRHGFGYSVFEHRAHGIESSLRMFVAPGAPLKYSVLTLTNDSDARRRLSATAYVEWMLDAAGMDAGLQIVTDVDLASGALLARNAFGAGFHDKVAFFHVEGEATHTCDRSEFIGRHGSIANPEALARIGLSGAGGAGYDPCAALQVGLTLAPGETRELVFMLGLAGPGSLDASAVVQRHAGASAAAWDSLTAWWETTLGAFRIESNDAAFDLRVNGWLPYQAVNAIWGERCTATRLQSALALLHARPELLRAELLRAAREFATNSAAVEDFLWLPFALSRYVAHTDDAEILATLPFDQHPGAASRLAAADDLYQHCVQGLRGCLRFGARGLPPAALTLHDETPGGQGESVRLAFFMMATLQRFADLADRRDDFGFTTTCRGAALALGAQCEEHGWDGEWYRWCYLENGNVLGAAANPACRVDLATQCWAVQAGAARGDAALSAAIARLHDEENGLLPLSEPALDGVWAERVDAWPGQEHRTVALAVLGLIRAGDAARAWQLAGMLEQPAHAAAPPYLLGAGVRTIAPRAGRAIGDNFSNSAAWTWLALIEGMLGVERRGARLHLRPNLAPGWDGVHLSYRHRGALYDITVQATDGEEALLLDGAPCPDWSIELVDDRLDHRVEAKVRLSAR